MKPAPHRLDIASYPLRKSIETRVGDVNRAQHISNTAIAEIYDDARFDLLRPVWIGSGARVVLAQTNLTYLAEIHHPSRLTVGTAVAKIGRSSFELFLGLFLDAACVGLCDAVFVNCDADGPRPMTGTMTAYLAPIAYGVPADRR